MSTTTNRPAGRPGDPAHTLSEAARRDIRRRFNQGEPQPVISRPGAYFYVTAVSGPHRRIAWLLGPYVSHLTALAQVRLGDEMAQTASDYYRVDGVGTVSDLFRRRTVFGQRFPHLRRDGRADLDPTTSR